MAISYDVNILFLNIESAKCVIQLTYYIYVFFYKLLDTLYLDLIISIVFLLIRYVPPLLSVEYNKNIVFSEVSMLEKFDGKKISMKHASRIHKPSNKSDDY